MNRLILITLLAATTSARAEETQAANPAIVQRLTLEDAINRARATSARLDSFTALTRSANEGVRGARAARQPELNLQAAYSRHSNVPELVLAFPGSAPRTIFPNLPSQWRTQIGATLPLYTGGRIEGQIQAASEAALAATSDRDAALNDLVAETHVAYASVLFARENARVLREATASYEAHLKDARARQDMGLVASHEVLAVTVERERAELGRVQAENAAAVAIANLLRLVGLPAGTSVELEPARLDEGRTENDEDLVTRAVSARPELEALRARLRALDGSARVARSTSRPQAGLQAGFDYANPNPRILPLTGDWKDSWSVGVNLSWKVLDGGRSSAAVAQNEAQAEALRAQIADFESRIRLEVTARRLELDSALSARAVTKRAIEAAREAVRVARDRYQEGVAASSDLLDAETRLLRAELEATQTEALIQMAVANLNRAAGR